MDILTLLLTAVFLLILVLFSPEIFPHCMCCRKIKFRPHFKVHKAVKINLGYTAHNSICKKCCRQYNINGMEELEKLISAKRKAEISISEQNNL